MSGHCWDICINKLYRALARGSIDKTDGIIISTTKAMGFCEILWDVVGNRKAPEGLCLLVFLEEIGSC